MKHKPIQCYLISPVSSLVFRILAMHDSNLYCKKKNAVDVEQCIIHFVLLQQLLYYSLSQLEQHNLEKQNDP